MGSQILLLLLIAMAHLSWASAPQKLPAEMNEGGDEFGELDQAEESEVRDKRSPHMHVYSDEDYDEMMMPMMSRRRSWMSRQAAECTELNAYCYGKKCCRGLCRKYKSDREMYLSYYRCRLY